MAGTGGDWAAQTADTIERVVVRVRSKTSEPLERLARILVYGVIALVLGIGAVVLLVVMLIRLLDVAIPGRVWIPYLLLGGIFVVSGLFVWRKRTVKTMKV